MRNEPKGLHTVEMRNLQFGIFKALKLNFLSFRDLCYLCISILPYTRTLTFSRLDSML